MNIELFKQAVDKVRAHPEEWDQEWFERAENPCGTACCIAGHVVEISNVVPTVKTEDIDYSWATEYQHFSEAFDGSVPGLARRLLGITVEQARWLFDWKRTLRDFDAVITSGVVPDFDQEENALLEKRLAEQRDMDDGG